jgi:hypothetical protein
VYDSSFDHQHNLVRKFARTWLCVTTDNANQGEPTDIENESIEDSDREIEIVIDLVDSEDTS